MDDHEMASKEWFGVPAEHIKETLGYMLKHFGSCGNCAAKWTQYINENAGKEVIRLVQEGENNGNDED